MGHHMKNSEITEDDKLAFEIHNLERENEILETINYLKLNEKSYEWLVREVAKLRLELKDIEENRAAEPILTILKYKLFKIKTKQFAQITQASGYRDTEESRAIRKAKRLWEAACNEGAVSYGGKDRFIENMQFEHPDDIGKLSFENLSKNVLKYPIK